MNNRVRGRRRGSPDTREQILVVARQVFAQRGVAAASVRAIAVQAGVDPSLVLHFFGSKAGLLEAAIEWPFDIDGVRERILAGGIDEVGERLARAFLEVWDSAGEAHPVLLLLRVSGTDDSAAAQLVRLLDQRLLGPMGRALRERYGPAAAGDDWPERAALLAGQLLGLALTRYVLRLDPVAAMPADRLADWVAPRLQSCLTAPAPPRSSSPS